MEGCGYKEEGGYKEIVGGIKKMALVSASPGPGPSFRPGGANPTPFFPARGGHPTSIKKSPTASNRPPAHCMQTPRYMLFPNNSCE
jgi:hypothetical protein